MQGWARLGLSRCLLRQNGLGVELQGRSRAALDQCEIVGGEHGLWLQNQSRARCRGGVWDGAGIGARASHETLLELVGGRFRACRKAALYVEDNGAARARGAEFSGNENAALCLNAAWLRLSLCALDSNRDTAVWGDYRSCLDVRHNAFTGNGKDVYREYRPIYE